MQGKTTRHHFTPTTMATVRRQAVTSAGKDGKQLEPSDTAGGNVKWRPRCGKQPGSSLLLQLPQLLLELHELFILFKVGIRVLIL